MEETKIRELAQKTTDFYKNHGVEFSKSRQSNWLGWDKCLDIIKNNFARETISVLDIACGNGRFYQFLRTSSDYKIDYLGLDNNDYMLIEGVMKYQLASFLTYDVFFDLPKLTKKYDVVSVFGFTHHIPDANFRLHWFEQLVDLLNPNGLLLITFWDLSPDDRFSKAVKADDLEENDYYYGWGDSEDKRYVHIYSEEELKKITDTMAQKNCQLLDSYMSDGKNNNLNKYLIFLLQS